MAAAAQIGAPRLWAGDLSTFTAEEPVSKSLNLEGLGASGISASVCIFSKNNQKNISDVSIVILTVSKVDNLKCKPVTIFHGINKVVSPIWVIIRPPKYGDSSSADFS